MNLPKLPSIYCNMHNMYFRIRIFSSASQKFVRSRKSQILVQIFVKFVALLTEMQQIMFTGLIEELGTIKNKQPRGSGYRFTVQAKLILDQLATGDSVNVNGVCQTVVSRSGSTFDFETVEETVKKTTLGDMPTNKQVNLERALKADGRLGGHFVLGHVDCTGSVLSIRQLSAGFEMEIQYPVEFAASIVPVGSIAVDGVSLTVAELQDTRFKVAVIPHTWKETTFPLLKAGDKVNLEFDVLGKYVERILHFKSPKNTITESWLHEKGF